jgi:Uma2 family endonuclease
MSSAYRRYRHSFADYLEIEEMSPVKHEFLNGEIYAMAGGTPEHAALCASLIVHLGALLRGRPCRVYTADLRVRVLATGLATYPDAAVICGEAERDPESPTHVTNPTVLFEVTSPGTEAYDRSEKREHYQQIDSLRELVIVSQRERQVEVWRRTADGWSNDIAGAGQTFDLPSIDGRLAVDDLYATAGLDLP